MTAHKVAPIITATTKKLSPNGLGGGGPGRERASISAPHSSDVLKQFGNAQFSTFKAALTELAVAKLAPIGAEMKRLLADPAAIDAVLTDGAGRAQKLARQTMDAVKDVVGFVRSS